MTLCLLPLYWKSIGRLCSPLLLLLCVGADTTLAELNSSLVREEEGLVACRGLVATYTGSIGQGPTAAEMNDNQVWCVCREWLILPSCWVLNMVSHQRQ